MNCCLCPIKWFMKPWIQIRRSLFKLEGTRCTSFLSILPKTSLYLSVPLLAPLHHLFPSLQSLIQGCCLPSSLATLPPLFLPSSLAVSFAFLYIKKKKKKLIINCSTMELMAHFGKREKIMEGPHSTFIWHRIKTLHQRRVTQNVHAC